LQIFNFLTGRPDPSNTGLLLARERHRHHRGPEEGHVQRRQAPPPRLESEKRDEHRRDERDRDQEADRRPGQLRDEDRQHDHAPLEEEGGVSDVQQPDDGRSQRNRRFPRLDFLLPRCF
jgi:hypothetical protein